MGTLLPANVTVRMEMDVEAMVLDAVLRARAAAGEPPLPAGQSADLVAHALRELEQGVQAQAEALRQRTCEAQPEGVTLLEMAHSQQGSTVRSTLRFDLVDLRLLPKVAVAIDAPGDALAHPFEGFKVTRHQGSTLVQGTSPDLPAPADARGSVQLELEVEATVHKHTATRAQGSHLVWECALGDPPLDVRATFAPR